FFLHGELIHQIEHELFKNDAKSAGADVAFDGIQGDPFERVIRKLQLHILVFEQALVLLDERVLRTSENVDQRFLVQVVQSGHNRNAADELRNHAELDQVFGFELLQQSRAGILGFDFDIAVEAHGAANRQSALNHLVHANECSSAYEEDVRRVNLRKLLMRMFSAALRRNVSDRSLQHFQ